LIISKLTDQRFDILEKKLSEIEDRTGLLVEFTEDDIKNGSGLSYQKATKLIENAKIGLTIVSPWEPFAEYLDAIPNPSLKNARIEYYEAIQRQIERHQNDISTFHRRIIQVATEYENKPLTFRTDTLFYKYLKFVSEMQKDYPRSCHIKKAKSYIDIHFTIIDNKYVIMPIFSHDERNHQTRYGALIFNDTQGTLVNCLEGIYRFLETHGQAITPEQLIAP